MKQQQIYYRPEWTCGRYNANADVALMYNLIEGKSFFFESYSARVIAKILAAGRNGQVNADAIATEIQIPIQSVIDFIESDLIGVGLVTTRIFEKDEIRTMRRKWSEANKQESLHYNLATFNEENVFDSQTAEVEYGKYLDIHTQVKSVQLELTYRCSEKCIHCYNIGATRNDNEKCGRGSLKEMSLADYKHLIDELDAAGCYRVCLTGGDPFAKSVVWEIIDYLYQKEIAFDIFTNGQAITSKIERLIDYYPRFIGISIYSGIPEVHDSITRIKGSFERSISVAEILFEYGVPMSFKCVVMKPNLKSYHLVKDLAKRYGAVIQIEANMMMGTDGDMSMINHLRLSREELEVLLRDKDIPLYVGLDLKNEGRIKKAAEAYPCSGAYGSYGIMPNGNMVVCSSLHWVLGNVCEHSVVEILDGPALREWRNLNIGKIEGCGTKLECDYCNLCSGNNFNEYGVLTKPSGVNCFMASVRYELMKKLKKGEDTLQGLSVPERLAQMADDEVVQFGKEIKEH